MDWRFQTTGDQADRELPANSHFAKVEGSVAFFCLLMVRIEKYKDAWSDGAKGSLVFNLLQNKQEVVLKGT